MVKKKNELVPVGSGSVSLRIITEDEIPQDYDGALELVQQLMNDGRKVMLLHNWNVGRVIASIQDNEGRYGSKAVERMAESLECKTRILHEMLRFYKAHEKVDYVSTMKVEWSSARLLLQIPDDDKREAMEIKAAEKKLTVREVKEWVKKENSKGKPKKDKPKKKTQKARAYFLKLRGRLETDLESLKELMLQYPDMLKAVSDEDATSDEDYEEIVNGTERVDSLVEQIGKLGERNAGYLRTSVIVVRNAFPADA